MFTRHCTRHDFIKVYWPRLGMVVHSVHHELARWILTSSYSWGEKPTTQLHNLRFCNLVRSPNFKQGQALWRQGKTRSASPSRNSSWQTLQSSCCCHHTLANVSNRGSSKKIWERNIEKWHLHALQDLPKESCYTTNVNQYGFAMTLQVQSQRNHNCPCCCCPCWSGRW